MEREALAERQTMYTRREFGKLTLAGLTIPRMAFAATSIINGVRLGAQTYSFRDLPRTAGGDAVGPLIKAITDCGLSECELWSPQVEPPQPPQGGGERGAGPSPDAARAREALRKWRLETPLEYFRDVKKKFD